MAYVIYRTSRVECPYCGSKRKSRHMLDGCCLWCWLDGTRKRALRNHRHSSKRNKHA